MIRNVDEDSNVLGMLDLVVCDKSMNVSGTLCRIRIYYQSVFTYFCLQTLLHKSRAPFDM